ncbi:MAG: hypothetical protein KDA32_00100 [Phycisphaerales bacterium]|nr:hypothetical protein [Phycisphaerales bacterium]
MSILADITFGSWTPALLVMGAIVVMMGMIRRNYRPTGTVREVARDNMARLKEQRDVRDSMDKLLIELEEVSRTVSAEIETRFAKLEVAIKDADARLAELRSLAESGVRAENPTDRDGADVEGLNAAPTDDRARQGATEIDVLLDDFEPNPRPSPTVTVTIPKPIVDDRRLAMAEALKQKVHELQDAGRRPMEIAESLGVTLGEVELLLQLRAYGGR